MSAPVQRVCLCAGHGCSGTETRDESGNKVRGKRMGEKEFWEHHTNEKRLKYLVSLSFIALCCGDPSQYTATLAATSRTVPMMHAQVRM